MWPRISNYPERGLENGQRALHKSNVRACVFACNCTHSCGVLDWLSPVHMRHTNAPRRAALGCVSGGSGAARLRLSQGVPLFYRCCSGGYIHPRFITPLTLPPRAATCKRAATPGGSDAPTTPLLQRVSSRTTNLCCFVRETSGLDHVKPHIRAWSWSQRDSWILSDAFNQSASFLVRTVLSWAACAAQGSFFFSLYSPSQSSIILWLDVLFFILLICFFFF